LAPLMPPFIHLASKFSTTEVIVIGLLFWLLLAGLHYSRNRPR
jgi:hypothetical protein